MSLHQSGHLSVTKQRTIQDHFTFSSLSLSRTKIQMSRLSWSQKCRQRSSQKKKTAYQLRCHQLSNKEIRDKTSCLHEYSFINNSWRKKKLLTPFCHFSTHCLMFINLISTVCYPCMLMVQPQSPFFSEFRWFQGHFRHKLSNKLLEIRQYHKSHITEECTSVSLQVCWLTTHCSADRPTMVVF